MKESSFFIEQPSGYVAYEFYEPFEEAYVIERPNRFIVRVKSGKKERTCHLHDPGRLKELIYPGNRVMIRDRKGVATDCSVVSAPDNNVQAVIDSRIHSDIASKFLRKDAVREVKIGNHRLDFRVDDIFIEVKGCTLVKNHRAIFPDAPTLRGREHIKLLREIIRDGKTGVLIILVLRNDSTCFVPNRETDPEFYELFFKALSEGMELKILSFYLDGQKVIFDRELELCESFNA